MKPNLPPPYFHIPSSLEENASVTKGTEDTQNKGAGDAASSSAALSPTNKKTARNSPSSLQKSFMERKQSGEYSSEHSLRGTTSAAEPIRRPGIIAFSPEKQIAAATNEAMGKVWEHFSGVNEDILLTARLPPVSA